MKKIIRSNVFETNSSSTHSLSIVTEDVYDSWVAGETVMVDSWREKNKFISKEDAVKEIIEKIKKNGTNFTTLEEYLDDNCLEDIEELFSNYEYVTPQNHGGEYYETFEEYFTTPSGDKMVAFGYFGEDR